MEDNHPTGIKPICPECFHENEEHVGFCRNCGAPLGFISTIGPLERVHALGFTLRKAVSRPCSKLTLIGIWLLFGPLMVGLPGIPLFSANGVSISLKSVPVLLLQIGLWLIAAAILYKFTKNYFHKPPES